MHACVGTYVMRVCIHLISWMGSRRDVAYTVKPGIFVGVIFSVFPNINASVERKFR